MRFQQELQLRSEQTEKILCRIILADIFRKLNMIRYGTPPMQTCLSSWQTRCLLTRPQLWTARIQAKGGAVHANRLPLKITNSKKRGRGTGVCVTSLAVLSESCMSILRHLTYSLPSAQMTSPVELILNAAEFSRSPICKV